MRETRCVDSSPEQLRRILFTAVEARVRRANVTELEEATVAIGDAIEWIRLSERPTSEMTIGLLESIQSMLRAECSIIAHGDDTRWPAG